MAAKGLVPREGCRGLGEFVIGWKFQVQQRDRLVMTRYSSDFQCLGAGVAF